MWLTDNWDYEEMMEVPELSDLISQVLYHTHVKVIGMDHTKKLQIALTPKESDVIALVCYENKVLGGMYGEIVVHEDFGMGVKINFRESIKTPYWNGKK